MPRAKKNQDSPSVSPSVLPRAVPSDADWGGYINIKLTDEDKEAARLWIRDNEREALSLFDDALGQGFKFSLSFDAENQSYISTFTGAGWEGSKLRCALSARAGTWFESLALLVYKHHVMAGANWGQYRTDGSKVPTFG